jgi:hypothetical protein
MRGITFKVRGQNIKTILCISGVYHNIARQKEVYKKYYFLVFDLQFNIRPFAMEEEEILI